MADKASVHAQNIEREADNFFRGHSSSDTAYSHIQAELQASMKDGTFNSMVKDLEHSPKGMPNVEINHGTGFDEKTQQGQLLDIYPGFWETVGIKATEKSNNTDRDLGFIVVKATGQVQTHVDPQDTTPEG